MVNCRLLNTYINNKMNKNGSKWIRRSTRLAVYLRDDFTCLYCSRYLGDSPQLLTLDHVLPISKEGRYNDVRNLATSCRNCNNLKGSRVLSESEYANLEPRLMKELPRSRSRLVIKGNEKLSIDLTWLR